MIIVFFGSSEFATESLKALLNSDYDISCVVTQPDKQKGRHLHLATTAVKKIAQVSGLKIYQPQDINTPEAVDFLKRMKPDLFVVVAYGQIISQNILDIPKLFSINAHASLLPKYRGAAPINWALINGDKETGLSIVQISLKMDAGPIILQRKIEITQEDTVISLEEKLGRLAAMLLIESLILVEKKEYRSIAQDESKATFAPKLKKEDGLIKWDETAVQIHNLIRGCLGWPGAFTSYIGKRVKIFKAMAVESIVQETKKTYGQIIEVAQGGIRVLTGKGDLIIEELQIEGKRRMTAGEFISGHKISVGEKFCKK